MAGLEDAVRSRPLTALGLAVAGLAVPVVFPALRRPLARGVKAAVKLYVEAEAGAEADIIDQLAEAALDDLVKAVAHPEPETRRAAARAALRRFTTRAHRRSRRRGRDDADRERRYARHIGALAKRIAHRRDAAPADHRESWDRVLSELNSQATLPVATAPRQEGAGARH
jgi:hypothetical protein